jgi:hypothetical protein
MSSPTLLPPSQLAAMAPADQNRYLASLSAQEAAQERAALNAFVQSIAASNQNFLRKSLDHRAICPPSGGAGGTSALYPTAGGSLQFNMPTAGGAFIRELEIAVDIKFTPATGTSATYAWTPAGAFAWFSDIILSLGGTDLHHTRPYAMKVLDTIRRGGTLPYNQVLSGLNADSTVTSNIAQAQPAMTGGTPAISKFRFRVPFQQQRLSPVGLIPAQGQGSKGVLTLQCPSTLGAANADPLATPILYTGGTGNGITLDSTERTVTVYAIYNDGTGMEQKAPLTLNMNGVPTMQHLMDQQLNPFTAGTVMRQRLTILQKHFVAMSVIIDGLQSTSFSTAANITSIELDKDAAGNNKFFYYGAAQNTSYYDYATEKRRIFQQDLDTGVVLWTHALSANSNNPDNNNGTQVLDMRAGHWPEVNYGVNVASVSNTNFPARVETFLFAENDTGLVVAS